MRKIKDGYFGTPVLGLISRFPSSSGYGNLSMTSCFGYYFRSELYGFGVMYLSHIPILILGTYTL